LRRRRSGSRWRSRDRHDAGAETALQIAVTGDAVSERESERFGGLSRGADSLGCVGLGEIDEAFVWLERGFQQRNGWLIHMRDNPRYDPLRTDPRYLDLVRRMNFPERS